MKKNWKIPLLIAISFSVLFISLSSKQYLSVDGSLRSLPVFFNPGPAIHGNNHLLYPMNVYVLDQLRRFLHIPIDTPFEFLRLVQGMNAIAMAGGIALLFVIARDATASLPLSFLVCLLYGFSRAVILHATHAAEPPVALFEILLSFFCLLSAVKSGKKPLAFLSGLFVSLAMATYQAMGLLGPALWITCLRHRDRKLTLPFLTGAAVGAISLYGTAYWLTGTHSLLDMATRFLTVKGATTYSQNIFSGLYNLPIGMLRNILPILPDYPGLRETFRSFGSTWTAMNLLIPSIFLLAFLLSLLWAAFRNRRDMNRDTEGIFLAGLIGVPFVLIAALTWGSHYDKLWLLPLALLTLLCGISLKFVSVRFRPAVYSLAIVFALLEGTWNISRAIADHRKETPYIHESEAISKIVQSKDLLIHDWDPLSVTYSGFWGERHERFDVPGNCHLFTPDQLIARIYDEISRKKKAGGQVYLLALLDHTNETWGQLLGSRAHLPYQLVEDLRKASRLVATYPVGNGRETTLWRFEGTP